MTSATEGAEVGWALSIDFGTANTAAAVCHDGKDPQPVEFQPAYEETMPSAVLATPQGFRVGSEARNARLLYPQNYIEFPKGEIGNKFIMLDQEYEVAEVVGEVLKFAVNAAKRDAGGTDPHTVILTHPHDWASRRRKALRAAWDRSGIASNTVRLVPESLAAAAWYAHRSEIPEVETLAVFDYGAGTCDVAVLRACPDKENSWPFEVVAHDGRDRLGGRQIDQALRKHIRDHLAATGRQDLLGRAGQPGPPGSCRDADVP